MEKHFTSRFEHNLYNHLARLYPNEDLPELMQRCLAVFDLQVDCEGAEVHRNLWSEQDVMLITYGDSIRQSDEPPLQTLHTFCNQKLQNVVSVVHILPFFPYSSDDGFSVIDYRQVNPTLGDWQHVSALSDDFAVMADLVLNHCSSKSQWFSDFIAQKAPYTEYFIVEPEDLDTTAVTRPRTSPLLRPTITKDGTKHVWCTFSHDQVDMNFRNPKVLLEFLDILRFYLDHGIRWFRLDAVAFLWKTPGTNCINLPETHEAIRLLRLLIEHYANDSVVITETNIPNQENLTYFGNANEAHLIYNFSLPPLLINTLITGNCSYLKKWLMSMPTVQPGTTYLNFIASHDGIGLRPVEGLLSEWEVETLVNTMKRFGGMISSRTTADGSEKPYEINISLWNALAGSVNAGPDHLQFSRFICAHAIMMVLQGVPAIYIHSFIATENDLDGVKQSSRNRRINRHRWDLKKLNEQLCNQSHHQLVFDKLRQLLQLRKQQVALHPNAQQIVLQMSDKIFAVWRLGMDQARNERNFVAVFNIDSEAHPLALSELNLPESETGQWIDLIENRALDIHHEHPTLAPYQFLWLVDK